MVLLQDFTHTAGATVIHQFCHIGSFSFVGGGSVVRILSYLLKFISILSPSVQHLCERNGS